MRRKIFAKGGYMTEFEKWKQKSKLYKVLKRDIQLYGSANCSEGDLQAIFEIGQKHPEWIPVTERLPTENDGKIIIDNSNWFERTQKYIKVLCKWKNDKVTIESFSIV